MNEFRFPGQEHARTVHPAGTAITPPPPPAPKPGPPLTDVQRRISALKMAIDSSRPGSDTAYVIGRARDFDTFLIGAEALEVEPHGATRYEGEAR